MKLASQFLSITRNAQTVLLQPRHLRLLTKQTLSQFACQQTGSHVRNGFHTFIGASVAAVLGTSIVYASEAEKQTYKKISVDELEKVIKEADILYSQNKHILYDFLKPYEDVESGQICWRLARAACDTAEHFDAESKYREVFMREGFKHAERSIKFDDNCGDCHRWYAYMLCCVGHYEGNKKRRREEEKKRRREEKRREEEKKRIKNFYVIKEHYQKAIDLNGKDAIAMYNLGMCCFYYADKPWYYRLTTKIAAIIFASRPTVTFQDALGYFLLAEKTDPNFSMNSMNHVMIAKTYLKLNMKVLAIEHMIKARDLPVRSPCDREARMESIQLLDDL